MNKLLEPYGTIHLVRTHTGRREKKQEHTPCVQEGGTTSKYVQEKNTILHVLCTIFMCTILNNLSKLINSRITLHGQLSG